MKILNLTQHVATAEQVAAGVVDLPPDERRELQRLLTFEELPSEASLEWAVLEIEALARRAFRRDPDLSAVMIGGAPFLMPPLQAGLLCHETAADVEEGERPFAPSVLYAFSRRESVEEKMPDGSVRKTQIFRHAGFVEAAR